MTFIDVPTTARKRMTPSRALRIWEAHAGVCVTCKRPIDGVRDRWFIEHLIALELGGPDTDANCGPAHYACKAGKDADDHHRAAKAKRAKRQAFGIQDQTRRKLQGAGFPKAPKQRSATRPLSKRVGQFNEV